MTEDQLTALRQLSSGSGREISDLAREGVETILSRRHRRNRAAGRFSSGTKDGSARHGRYLAEAFRDK